MAPGLWIRGQLSDPAVTFASAKSVVASQKFIVPAYITIEKNLFMTWRF